MKDGIHPKYNEIKATCSCGSVINIRSTLSKDLNLDVSAAEADPTYNKANKVGKPQYEALARKMVASVQTEKLESIPVDNESHSTTRRRKCGPQNGREGEEENKNVKREDSRESQMRIRERRES